MSVFEKNIKQGKELAEISKTNYRLLAKILKDKINDSVFIKVADKEPILLDTRVLSTLTIQDFEGQYPILQISMNVNHYLEFVDIYLFTNKSTGEEHYFYMGVGITENKIACSIFLTQYLEQIIEKQYQIFDSFKECFDAVNDAKEIAKAT